MNWTGFTYLLIWKICYMHCLLYPNEFVLGILNSYGYDAYILQINVKIAKKKNAYLLLDAYTSMQ